MKFIKGFLAGFLITISVSSLAIIGGGIIQHNHSGATSGGSTLTNTTLNNPIINGAAINATSVITPLVTSPAAADLALNVPSGQIGRLNINSSTLYAWNSIAFFPASSNSSDTGTSGNAWRSGYFGTSIFTPVISSATGVTISGTTTNDSASAGNVGEYIASTINSGSSVALTTNVTTNITSVSLTAGDWDCTGAAAFTFAGTTSYTNLTAGTSTTSAAFTTIGNQFDFEAPATVPTATQDPTFALPTARFSLASTTTVFMPVQATFTVSTLRAYGVLRCRRVR